MLPAFCNEALTDFSNADQQRAFQKALDHVKAEIGRTYPLVIGGERLAGGDLFPSINPSRPDEVVGMFARATVDQVDRAVETAAAAFEHWRFTPVDERARYLLRAAAEMRRRKHEFSAVMVLEVGKSWAEADADTAEAIDFLEYYARQMMRIADSSALLTPYPPEQLSLVYLPLGVGAIIPPWNFPNAIPTGMVGAALVAGNTVVFKPAEQSMWIAYKLCELFWDAGLPDGVLNFVTGAGEVVGARMVEHPQTRFIAFTGSKAVGLEINEKAARQQPGQRWLKRAILEMGGKDAIIIDETADLAAAAQGVVASAFGFQGQKCSACSRAVIVNSVYKPLAEEIVRLTNTLKVGVPDRSPQIDLGPVVDEDAFNRINRYIGEIGMSEGELLTGGATHDSSSGYFILPTVFGEVAPDARIATEEIFGPVLALISARGYDDAIAIANSSEYGLTGAVYSRDTRRLEQARREFHVGNLYFNRKCTGAMVGVHPFGGFNMSGTDSKAGGPDYLLLFTQAKSMAQRL